MRLRIILPVVLAAAVLTGCANDNPDPAAAEDIVTVQTAESVETGAPALGGGRPELRTFAFGEPIVFPEGTATITAERKDFPRSCKGLPDYQASAPSILFTATVENNSVRQVPIKVQSVMTDITDSSGARLEQFTRCLDDPDLPNPTGPVAPGKTVISQIVYDAHPNPDEQFSVYVSSPIIATGEPGLGTASAHTYAVGTAK